MLIFQKVIFVCFINDSSKKILSSKTCQRLYRYATISFLGIICYSLFSQLTFVDDSRILLHSHFIGFFIFVIYGQLPSDDAKPTKCLFYVSLQIIYLVTYDKTTLFPKKPPTIFFAQLIKMSPVIYSSKCVLWDDTLIGYDNAHVTLGQRSSVRLF